MVFGSFTISNDSISTSDRYVTRARKRTESTRTTFLDNVRKVQEERIERNRKEIERKIAAEEKKQQAIRAQSEEELYAWEDEYIYDQMINLYNQAVIATTKGYKKGNRYSEVKGSFNASSVNFNKNNNAISFDEFAEKGVKYSSDNGQKLAKDVANNSVGFTGYCSKHVRESLQRTKMYNGHTASAYQMGGVLAENKNFQEIKIANKDDLKKLPAGCVLVYDRGAAGYNFEHGHIEVTLGDGTACSDGRTCNIRYSNNMRVFIPVEQA